jgi:imidazolonepropionase-like amidohydrolase
LARIAPCLIALGLCWSSGTAHELRIEHVTVVSPERPKPMRDVTVHIRGERIVSISRRSPPPASHGSEAAEVIDGRGLYLAPGLIDSHVHTGQVHGMTREHEQAHPDIARAAREQNPRSYLYFGFTTLIDLISAPAQIKQWNAHAVHPDIYFCGATPIVDGYPMIWAPKPERYQQFPYLLVQREQEATAPEGIDPAAHTPEAVVSRMKADGAFCVKTFYDRGEQDQWPAPRLDTIRALVKAAHAARMPVFIHTTSTEAQEFALEAGVDIIAHGLWRWNGEADATALTPRVRKALNGVLKDKVGWQPTMQVGYGFRDLFDPRYLLDPRLARVLPAALIEWCRTSEGQWFRDRFASSFLPKPIAETRDAEAQWEWVRAFYGRSLAPLTNATNYMAAHNARLLFATDTPSSPLYTNPPGLNGWMEMHRLIEAGLTPAQVFRAATLANAEALGLGHEIGTVQVGKRANLLLLREDPTRSIQAYDKIVKVVLRGRVLDRSALAANSSANPDGAD